ncbi:MAG: SMI1/KNR4 family protein [Planctomycetaceae bacterium]
MDANDFAFIEDRLSVVLPTAFKQFMVSFPNDSSHQLQNDCNVLECNGELFAIGQLQRFFNPNGLDYYELQPELRSRRFIEIGGDGCGNYFCMVGDDADSNEVWMWEHDPYNGLGRCEDFSLTGYFTNGNWELATCPDPFVTTSGIFIIRSDHPVRAIFKPIRMDEWLRYVDQSETLQLDENHVGKNPFTKEEITFRRWPGRAKLLMEGHADHISYFHGSLSLGVNVTSIVQSHVERIADDLNAQVWTSK